MLREKSATPYAGRWLAAALLGILIGVAPGPKPLGAEPVFVQPPPSAHPNDGADASSPAAEDPASELWDWARLDTGEWIKGELIVMSRGAVVFDSDKFDELEIDWEDIVVLRLARPRVFRVAGGRILEGMGELHDGILQVVSPDGRQVDVPAGEVVSITYADSLGLRQWTIRVGANLAARSGNTDQQDLGGNALIRRDATYTRWDTRYNGAFGSVDGTQTTNNHRASTQLDWIVTNHFFLRVPAFEFYLDEFQNIDSRYTLGAGIGYEPVDTPVVLYRMTLGSAVQISDFDGGGRSTDAAVVVGSELDLDLPHDVDLDLLYQLQLLVTDIGRTAHSTSAVLSFEIWGPLDLDVGAYWDRIEEPERGSDGEQPESDDFRLTVGVSIEF